MKTCSYCGEKFDEGETIKAMLIFANDHGGSRCCFGGGTLDGRSDYCVPCFMKLCDPHGSGKEHDLVGEQHCR